jgi:UDP-2,4-diacetamido-2,4,6-trideoxy-beta-L-altropyranose hydrolase
MDAPGILFVADAGPEIGGGHVMRCLTLAQAFAARGARVSFLATPAVASVLDTFADAAIGRVVAPAGDPAGLMRAAAIASEGFDAVVIDHYGLDAQAHRAIGQGRPSLAIDDLADRALDADVVVDPGPDRTAVDYAKRTSERARLLLGPDYAFVRPAFAAARASALARRGADQPASRVLVSMGLTDVGGITAWVVNRILPRLGDAALDVVLGPAAPSRSAIETLAARDPRVRALIDVRDMTALMVEADLAVGAGGSTTWERCVMGLATVLLVLAPNQGPVAASLARRGAVVSMDVQADDFEAAFDRAFTGLMRSPERRAWLSSVSAALCDGLGAPRVADAFLAVIAARG